jgi:hypothetical protein
MVHPGQAQSRACGASGDGGRRDMALAVIGLSRPLRPTPRIIFGIPARSTFHSMRRLVATLLLLFVFCQAFAGGGHRLALGPGEAGEAEHTLMHWEGVAHHHHAEGGTHQDNSDESIQHILADVMLGAGAALLPAPFASLLPARSPPPPATSESSGASTYPDGPRRPPRFPA